MFPQFKNGLMRSLAIGVAATGIATVGWASSNASGQDENLGSTRIEGLRIFDNSALNTGATAEGAISRRGDIVRIAKSAPKIAKTAGPRQKPIPPAPPGKDPQPVKPGNARPAIIATKDLADFTGLPAGRKKLLEAPIAVARDSSWLPYD